MTNQCNLFMCLTGLLTFLFHFIQVKKFLSVSLASWAIPNSNLEIKLQKQNSTIININSYKLYIVIIHYYTNNNHMAGVGKMPPYHTHLVIPFSLQQFSAMSLSFFYPRHPRAITQTYEGLFLQDNLYVLLVQFNIPYILLGDPKKLLVGVKWEKDAIVPLFLGFHFY